MADHAPMRTPLASGEDTGNARRRERESLRYAVVSAISSDSALPVRRGGHGRYARGSAGAFRTAVPRGSQGQGGNRHLHREGRRSNKGRFGGYGTDEPWRHLVQYEVPEDIHAIESSAQAGSRR